MYFSLQGNPYCSKIWSSEADAIRCTIYCKHKCVYENSNIESNKWKVVVAATSSSSALVLMLAMLCFAIILRQNQKYIRALQKKIRKADINAKSFEYNELRVATKNFAPEMKLGAGAYGAVYKVWLVPHSHYLSQSFLRQCFQSFELLLDPRSLACNQAWKHYVTCTVMFRCRASCRTTLW
ncbi:hypothetical protein M758_11G169200 [Ceratodon purpureus]|nr:hypothetical protein M758_11G169200 [Ceratodon purpureus]